MNCPVCTHVTLVMSERQGIEVDYCPQCRGVWLDRGELDKIIERSVPAETGPPDPGPQRYEPAPRDPRRQDHDDRYDYKRRKKKGFLSEIFDFD
jgi:uncharacterized protein